MENKKDVVEALVKALNGKNGTSIIGILAIAVIVIGDMIVNNHYSVEANGGKIKPVNNHSANDKVDEDPLPEPEEGATVNTAEDTADDNKL